MTSSCNEGSTDSSAPLTPATTVVASPSPPSHKVAPPRAEESTNQQGVPPTQPAAPHRKRSGRAPPRGVKPSHLTNMLPSNGHHASNRNPNPNPHLRTTNAAQPTFRTGMRPDQLGAQGLPYQPKNPQAVPLKRANGGGPIVGSAKTSTANRAHPHLHGPGFYVCSYPPDLPESLLADALRGCGKLRIKLIPAVRDEERLLPDMHYDWMPKNGTLEFGSMEMTEKALAIMVNHAFFAPRGVWVSPYPPPYILPTPENPNSARYIHPTRLAQPPQLPPNPSTEDAFRAYFPTPAEVYDAIRPWGAIRAVNSYVHGSSTEGQGPTHGHKWIARVEFWFEEDALKFDTGFGQTASLLKGWQIFIHGSTPDTINSSVSVPSPMTYQVPPRMMSQVSTGTISLPEHAPPTMETAVGFSAQPMGYITLPDGSIPPTPITATMQGMPNMLNGIPQPPPPINYVPPWAAHNMFAADVMPDGYVDPAGSPVTPISMGRRMSRTSMSSLSGRQRTWSLTLGESPDGNLRPTGLVADDGTYIQHGPGQHIRPAPAWGPGSNSASGLVDYSNVFVKNIDPDINSYYLEEIFSHIGQVVSARVMRDEEGRSRGYGFVSFQDPEQAAQAIAMMHNTVFGRSRISVTLHEPRKLRSEKMIGQAHQGVPVAFGRQSSSLPRRSMSPVRTERMGRGRKAPLNEPKSPATTDGIRSPSPVSQKLALLGRVSDRVRAYARDNGIAEHLVAPVVEHLVKDDLSLISLLHDKEWLDMKIGEVLSEVQLLEPTGKDGLITAKSHPESTSLRPRNEDLIRLRAEIETIDPANADQIMPVLLEMLSPSDWDKIWFNSGVAAKYGLAKTAWQRSVVGRQDGDDLAGNDEKPVRDLTVEHEGFHAKDGEHDNADLVPLEDLTIADLASHPARKILSNLQHDTHGPRLVAQLGLVEPSVAERANMTAWIGKTSIKNKVGRGVEVSGLLGKKVDIDSLKRSQKLKVIKQLITAENDDEALCGLTLYPAVLNAKVRALAE